MDQRHAQRAALAADDLVRLREARHFNPHAILGRHPGAPGESIVRVFLPGARAVRLPELDVAMERVGADGLFIWRGRAQALHHPCRLQWQDRHGRSCEAYDPYCFPLQISDRDRYLFNAGVHHHAYRFLGAHACVLEGVEGVRFATWAPNAERVSVIAEFNAWDGRRHAMSCHGSSGIWELFVPGVTAGDLYRYEIRNRASGAVMEKIDPYGREFEQRPATASRVPGPGPGAFDWGDQEWLGRRAQFDWQRAPISVYEVHLGSWKRGGPHGFLNYREIAAKLSAYVAELGFTHIELLPITEHPLDSSWGYQPTGFYAPTSRFGTPGDFAAFVDTFHRAGIGVILDWVPGHFPKDPHALARFDGTALYEHEDSRRGEHPDWGTLIFNYGRREIESFLLSSANFWLEEFHLDGLRVDAVASMLYLDYSREAGEWEPNIHGGRENLEAVAFLRKLNAMTHQSFPGTFTVAEESTSWPQVTRPDWVGGLGFSMKWNMGWMHDTLSYLAMDPVHRKFHHDGLTFGLLYAFHENFVLPLSHDEVVHGKKSLLAKMPGDRWQQFATLRLLYSYMFTYPGKKLLFMGSEIGVWEEWAHDREPHWPLQGHADHAGLQQLVRDLARLYRRLGALHRRDFDGDGFAWIDCHDSQQSVLTYVRRADRQLVVVALNFTPVPRAAYRIGVPEAGGYRELLNSDSVYYGGSGVGNLGHCRSEATAWMGHRQSLTLTLPPLGALVLEYAGDGDP